MKKRILYSLAALLLTGAMSSCSNEDNTAEERIDADKAEIIIDTEAYQADQDMTRTAWNRQTETVDLGNGLTAEVSVEADKQDHAAQTRAAMSNEHYTIYALDGSGTRVATMTGTVTGGNKFTRDASSPRMILTPGTYTFVCINDAVTDNGTSLTVSNGTANPMIGTTTQTISGPGWQISFAMKHQTTRIRYNIVSYTGESTGASATLTSASAHDVSANLALDGTTQTSTSKAAYSEVIPVPASGTVVNDPVTRTYMNATDYKYLLPGAPMSDLTFTINSGTIYGKSLAGKAFSLASSTKTLARGGSYTVNIKFTTFLFLFDDGTVGAIGDKGTRTPIAYVVKDKTDTEKGMAMALQPVKATFSWHNGGTDPGPALDNSAQFDETNWLTDMDGYKYTWEASGSYDGVNIKALNSNYPLFVKAANYTPSAAVTGANVGRWYVPALGEAALMLKRFKLMDLSNPSPLNETYIKPIATAVGGSYPTGFMRVSTEYLSTGSNRGSGVELYLNSGPVYIYEMVKRQIMPSWLFVKY